MRLATPKTTNLGLNKVDRTSPTTTTFNTKTLIDDNADLLDAKFGTGTDGHMHDGTAGNGPKLGSAAIADGAVGTAALAAKGVTQAKIGDKVVGAGQLADAAATDTVIGSRTVSDSTEPSGDAGTPTTLFGWLANMIKQITGKASWRTAPSTNLEAVNTQLTAATASPTASTMIKRDASGRAQVAAPTAAADIARKADVDAVAAAALPAASYTAADVLAKLKTVDGGGSGLDADTVDGYHLDQFVGVNSNPTFGNVTFNGATKWNDPAGNGSLRFAWNPDWMYLQDVDANGNWIKDIMWFNRSGGGVNAKTLSVADKLWVYPQTAYGAGFGGLHIALGDNDTGFKWVSDGVFEVYNNASMSGYFTSSGYTAAANTSYGSRYVRNTIISTSDPSGGQNGDIWIKYTP